MRLCCQILILASLSATAASTLSAYPHQLAYFNELAGGPENGHKHLLHSNLDWGQGLIHLREWLNEPSALSLLATQPGPPRAL